MNSSSGVRIWLLANGVSIALEQTTLLIVHVADQVVPGSEVVADAGVDV